LQGDLGKVCWWLLRVAISKCDVVVGVYIIVVTGVRCVFDSKPFFLLAIFPLGGWWVGVVRYEESPDGT